MGLPGSGKTTLAKKLKLLIESEWLNADEVRKKYQDFDFSNEGRTRQAYRMRDLADAFIKEGKNVIVDFVCPTIETRNIFNPNIIIWMDTIKAGRFDDTNKIFVKPSRYDFRISEKNSEIWSEKIFRQLKKDKKI